MPSSRTWARACSAPADWAGLADLGGSGSSGGGLPDALGGKLGETLGNLLQQGLGQGPIKALNQGRSQSRSLPPHRASPRPPPRRAAPGDPPPQQQDSQPMNDVLRQLFNR